MHVIFNNLRKVSFQRDEVASVVFTLNKKVIDVYAKNSREDFKNGIEGFDRRGIIAND
jgi:hypothetical protein